MRYTGLLDCNNFFVSCERLFRPDLRQVPTLVLSSNDGCVIARSQEIKDMEIPMGVPYFKIKDTLEHTPHAVFSSNFTLYRDISRRVFAVLREYVPAAEIYSIDEAFFVIEAPSAAVVEEKLQQIREAVMQQVGIPVSLGASVTKTQAKYANALAKKTTGVRVVENSEFAKLASDISLAMIWGVGRGRVAQFRTHGLNTVADVLNADSAVVSQLFGVAGTRLQAELSGRHASSRRVDEQQQSITNSRSFRKATTKREVLHDAVAYHLRHAAEELREKELCAASLRVLLRPSRHGNYQLRGGTREVVFTMPTNDTFVLLKEAARLVEQLIEADVPYQKAGVILSDLRPAAFVQAGLFAPTERSGTALLETVDSINERVGGEAVRIGSYLQETAWQAKREKLSPAYTTNWQHLPTATATTDTKTAD